MLGLVIAALAALGAAPSARAGRRAHANLLDPAPVPAVRAAVTQARADAPIPAPLNPAAPTLIGSYVASRCVPAFGPGTAYDTCRLGAVRSRHVVVLLGDPHAWMWIPAFAEAARQLGFELVPLTKPGCALWSLHENRPGWPCLTWYRGALGRIRALHPSATVVSFMTANFTVPRAPFAARLVQGVLRALPHPVLLADTPGEDWYANTLPPPDQCMSSAGANQGACAIPELPQVRATLAAIQGMVNRHGYPAIPTLQWFCADTVCPAVIDGTVTTEDGSHMTAEYAELLTPMLENHLRPLLRRLWRREAASASR